MTRYVDADMLCDKVLWDRRDRWDKRDILCLLNSAPAINTEKIVPKEKPIINFSAVDIHEKPFDTFDGID